MRYGVTCGLPRFPGKLKCMNQDIKIFVFLFFWVPGSCCLCKAQGNEQRTITSKLAGILPTNEVLSTTDNPEDINREHPPVPQSGQHQGFGASSPTGYVFIPGMPLMNTPSNQRNQEGRYQSMGENRPQPVVKLGTICAAKVALTGFMLIAGNIPYYIRSLRTPDKTGLRLTSQKSRIAAGNKGFKRVTGLTFAVPLARKF